MADLAQLVRALVCGTRCREFESHNPPHKKAVREDGFFSDQRSGISDQGQFQFCQVLSFSFLGDNQGDEFRQIKLGSCKRLSDGGKSQ